MSIEERVLKKERNLGFFERYLTLWVVLCMVLGIVLGLGFPGAKEVINSMSVHHVNIPIAILLFFMMYPIMVQIDFKQVIDAGKAPKPVLITLVVNWAIKPFTMAFLAWLFMRVLFAPLLPPDLADEYIAGMILLGIAPCTAMVLVWTFLAKGNMGHTIIMVAVNSLTMLFLYAPLGGWLLGATDLLVPYGTLFLSIALYVGVALVAGYFSRTLLIKYKGIEWYEGVFLKYTGKVSMAALLTTLVVLFMLQGDVIVSQPLIIALIAIPLIIQTILIFVIGYGVSKALGLSYEDAAPTAMIGASNHFEVAIAVAATLYGIHSGAALATVVGVLIEVPLMLALVRFCVNTQGWFRR